MTGDKQEGDVSIDNVSGGIHGSIIAGEGVTIGGQDAPAGEEPARTGAPSELEAWNTIPASLKPFFQDVDFESLDLERNAPTIIERTLSDGNVEEIRWLFARYDRRRIAAWVQLRGARRLPRDRCALWHILLGLEMPVIRRVVWSH